MVCVCVCMKNMLNLSKYYHTVFKGAAPVFIPISNRWASQVVPMVKNPPANAGDTRDVDSIPGSGRFPGVGNCNPLQCSCLENSVDRGAWWATVPGVTESDMTKHTCTYTQQHMGFSVAPCPSQHLMSVLLILVILVCI